MQVLLTNPTGTFDITGLCPTVRWSGDYQQAARSLDFSLLSSPADTTLPSVDCPPGVSVQLIDNEELLFDGFVISRTKSSEGNTIDLNCYDRGFYLKRNKASYKFSGTTAEGIARRVAGDFGLSVGELAATGVAITRNFLTGTSLYDIIATAYHLASQTTGKAYHIGFRGDKLWVTVKEPDDRTLILQGKSNLIAATTTESIAEMVNTVEVRDQNDKLVRTLRDESLVAQYGRLQSIVKQTKEDNKAAEAQKLLDDGGLSQKITVDCLGNLANVTGGTVVVQEPYTNLCGLFYIDGDTHEWKRGQYYNKLVLNFKAIMDEKEAGSLPNAKGAKTKSKSGKGKKGSSSSVDWDNVTKIKWD